MMTVKRKPRKQSLANAYSVIAYNVTVDYYENEHESICRRSCGTCKRPINLTVGTLVNENLDVNDKYVAIKIVNLEEQYNVSEEDLWVCPRDALLHVDKSVWPILSAVPSPSERVYLLREGKLLDKLSLIEVGSSVRIVKDGHESQSLAAVVKYKGPIPKKGPGVYFGVEILVWTVFL